MRSSIRAVSCALSVGFLAACGGGGDGGGGGGAASAPIGTAPPTTTTPATPTLSAGTLRGTVTTGAAKTAVAGASVAAGGQSAVTDAEGRYSLTFSDPAGASVVVRVAKGGFLTAAKEAPLRKGAAIERDITVYPVDVDTAFDAAKGRIIVVKGAVIDIPANALKDAADNPYAGAVRIVAGYRNPTTAEGVDAFPQPYAGIDEDGARVNLQTLGVIQADLFDTAGNPLQLSLPATLTYPGVSAIDQGAAAIPLWYYDTTRTTWVREGEATRLADGSYRGEVAHFSSWNLDRQWGGSYTGLTVKYCVNYEGGAATRYGIGVSITASGFSQAGYSEPLDAGTHELLNVPAYSALQIHFADAGDESLRTLNVQPTPPGQTVEVLPCVTLKGTEDYVPPPPPPPPTPATADAPPSTFDGTYASAFYDADPAPGLPPDSGSLRLTVAGGSIGGSGWAWLEPTQQSSWEFGVTGQAAAGGYVTMTATPVPASPAHPYGPIVFTGRFEYLGEGPSGTWAYQIPPAGLSLVSPRFRPERVSQ
jgi:hypothetical protein